jgi:hypothetical protein
MKAAWPSFFLVCKGGEEVKTAEMNEGHQKTEIFQVREKARNHPKRPQTPPSPDEEKPVKRIYKNRTTLVAGARASKFKTIALLKRLSERHEETDDIF